MNPLVSALTPLGRRLLIALGALLLAGSALASPSYLLVSAAPGSSQAPALASELANWREAGLVSDASLLDSGKSDGAAFGALAILEFPDEGLLKRWQDSASSQLAQGLSVSRADLLIRGEKTPRNSFKATFVATTFDVAATADAYQQFAKGYLAPQLDSMKAARVVNSYQLFNLRDGGSISGWRSILIVEYSDAVAYSKRDAATDAAHKKLNSNADWVALAEKAPSVETEKGTTLATMTELPPPDLSSLPSYVPEYTVVGGLRIFGSDLKGCVPLLAEGFKKYHPDAMVATNFMTSSEGSISGLYNGISDIAPAGDDAKITDQMPFFNTFNYVPTEISVATGGYEKRGALWALAIVVNKDNPLASLSLHQLECIFGSERTGGWEIGDNADHNLLYTAKYARSAASNIRTWDQLGLSGDYTGKEIQTYGYVAPGFAISFERKLFHWSKKYNPNFREYVETKEATNDDNGKAVDSQRMLEDISKDRYAIGWAALLHVRDYPNVKVLAISQADDTPAIRLTPENVSNRSYPLIRDAYFYVNKAPGRPLDPKVREFMRFVLSREGQEIIVKAGYFYPLPKDYLEEQRKKLE